MSEQQSWGDWLHENRSAIQLGLRTLWDWLKARKAGKKSGVLVIGPGGVGKTTLGKILSGQFDFLFDIPGPYDESLTVEKYTPSDSTNLEIVVPPGQSHRRESTWNELLNDLAKGEYRGLILMGAYGYHNSELGTEVSYKDHRLYAGDKSKFLKDFLEDRRQEEVQILTEIASRITPPPGEKFWFLTLVTKQDLWWQQRAEVEAFYKGNDYFSEIQKLLTRHGGQLFRHELVLASLVISNFVTGRNEELQPNSAGYDHKRHVLSLRKLFETLESLRHWEEAGT